MQVCGICVFSSKHGQECLLPIGEGTGGHTLSFSWLLIRIGLAFLMQTVVAYCRHVDSSTRYVGQRYPDYFGVVVDI